MTPSRANSAVQLGRNLWRDGVIRVALVIWALAAAPYFVPFLTADQLSIYSNFWLDVILMPVVLLAVLFNLRSLVAAERRFWLLIAAAMTAIFFAAFGFWTPPGRVLLSFSADLLYLTFYLTLALAALSAPEVRERSTMSESWLGTVGLAMALLWLLAYFVLVPATLDPERYQTWLPSMYLFQTLDLFVLFLFLRLWRNAMTTRWRFSHGLMALALALWLLLDLIETLGWANVVPAPPAGILDLLWTLPLAAVVIAARARHGGFDVEISRPPKPHAPTTQPTLSHVALAATVAFPLLHFGFAMANLVDPALNRAREVVTISAIISLGAVALLERARISRARSRDRRRRRKAETELRESEARYRTLVENAPEAIVILDPINGRFVDANRRALELFQLEREELLRVGPGDLSPSVQPGGVESKQAARDLVEQALAGEVPNFDWVHQNSAGRLVHCEVYLVAMPAQGRTLVRGSIIDVTDRLALRDQLRESRRTEAIGRLAGGVAHDFNNLLTVINGYTDLALGQPDVPSEVREMIGEIRQAGDKATRLIGQLLAFGRRQEMTPQPLDLNRALTELEPLLRRLLGEDLELDVQLDPNLTEVFADPAQVEQVIVNLAANGRDAMPGGGFLYVGTGSNALDRPKQLGSTLVPAGSYGWVSFRDTGVGMDESTRRRAFEPFFTTKGLGAGTGLGLATVHGIVAQSGGYVTVESAPARGSTFTAHLPLAPPGAASAAKSAPETKNRPARGRERVLFVEDQESVRSLHATGLRGLGYEVLAAETGDQALDLLGRSREGVHVLVTDVVLPGLSGPELAERILQLDPDVKVIFVSGYTDDLIRRKGRLASSTQFLQKPFSPNDLGRKIRAVMEAV